MQVLPQEHVPIALDPAQQRVFDHALELGRAAGDVLGIDAHHGFARFRPVATNGTTSSYSPLRGSAWIGMRSPQMQGPDGDLGLIETILHEGTHHVIRRHTGLPGLLAVGQPGILGEGLAQVVAGATLALLGADARERTEGWRMLDPHGQSARIGARLVPLSLTMDELRTRGPLLGDGGGVHVHGGIVQHAHWLLARAVGLTDMLAITGDALRRNLNRTTRLYGWAQRTVDAADARFGPASRQAAAVRDAWAGVRLVVD